MPRSGCINLLCAWKAHYCLMRADLATQLHQVNMQQRKTLSGLWGRGEGRRGECSDPNDLLQTMVGGGDRGVRSDSIISVPFRGYEWGYPHPGIREGGNPPSGDTAGSTRGYEGDPHPGIREGGFPHPGIQRGGVYPGIWGGIPIQGYERGDTPSRDTTG
jgi:hypothetical protein